MRHGGLGLRQLGVAVSHCKLNPLVANLMKVLCSQAIYRLIYQLFCLFLICKELRLNLIQICLDGDGI